MHAQPCSAPQHILAENAVYFKFTRLVLLATAVCNYGPMVL
jgi:hypothetical protein